MKGTLHTRLATLVWKVEIAQSCQSQPWTLIITTAKVTAESSIDEAIARTCTDFGVLPISLAGLFKASKAFCTSWPELGHFQQKGMGREWYGPLTGWGGSLTKAAFWPKGNTRVLIYYPNSGPVMQQRDLTLQRLGWSALWFSGRNGDNGTIRQLSEPISVPLLMSEADVAIGRGGHGFAAEVLRTGTPIYAIPDQLEAALLTYQFRRQGLIDGSPPNVFKHVGLASLSDLLDNNELVARLRQVASRYRRYKQNKMVEEIVDGMLAEI